MMVFISSIVGGGRKEKERGHKSEFTGEDRKKEVVSSTLPMGDKLVLPLWKTTEEPRKSQTDLHDLNRSPLHAQPKESVCKRGSTQETDTTSAHGWMKRGVHHI